MDAGFAVRVKIRIELVGAVDNQALLATKLVHSIERATNQVFKYHLVGSVMSFYFELLLNRLNRNTGFLRCLSCLLLELFLPFSDLLLGYALRRDWNVLLSLFHRLFGRSHRI